MAPPSNSSEHPSKDDQFEEKKKRIMDCSFRRALYRGLKFHFLPIGISISLIYLNLKDIYIGPALQFGSWTTTHSLAAFQVAAKIQV